MEESRSEAEMGETRVMRWKERVGSARLEDRKRLGIVSGFCFILDMKKVGVSTSYSNIFVFQVLSKNQAQA